MSGPRSISLSIRARPALPRSRAESAASRHDTGTNAAVFRVCRAPPPFSISRIHLTRQRRAACQTRLRRVRRTAARDWRHPSSISLMVTVPTRRLRASAFAFRPSRVQTLAPRANALALARQIPSASSVDSSTRARPARRNLPPSSGIASLAFRKQGRGVVRAVRLRQTKAADVQFRAACQRIQYQPVSAES